MSIFTPIETRMLKVLSDGLDHKREELHACLYDELSNLSAIQPHISRLRRKLHPIGQDIVCIISRGNILYRNVRMLHSSYDGS